MGNTIIAAIVATRSRPLGASRQVVDRSEPKMLDSSFAALLFDPALRALVFPQADTR